ncbi:hypothetical protein HELRODRAFT_151901, partial [Helobdella robusta]|uniref:receptor protein-tyrosine kinase n=1 Tax=Helobdella robusta TaxID=6412 RepID=T1EKM6_HELRO
NCLVSEDHVVKIADFGMTRDIYLTDYYRRGDHGVLPIRWMPKESIEAGFFSYESDVWSYGVVLWEIATLGHHPYMGLSNLQVCDFVMKGGRPNLPEGCDSLLATLMKKCWIRDPASRITFQGILDMLVDKVADDFKEVSYY